MHTVRDLARLHPTKWQVEMVWIFGRYLLSSLTLLGYKCSLYTHRYVVDMTVTDTSWETEKSSFSSIKQSLCFPWPYSHELLGSYNLKKMYILGKLDLLWNFNDLKVAEKINFQLSQKLFKIFWQFSLKLKKIVHFFQSIEGKSVLKMKFWNKIDTVPF